MAEPWFDPNTFGTWYGAIGGGLGGSLVGCFGGLAGYLAPRGKGRRFVLTAFVVFLILGVVQLTAGLAALACRQPFGIWYPMLLCGLIMSCVIGPLIPVIRKCYVQAEARRLDAEAIRRS